MFTWGFRPFFLCAGFAAVVLMAIWLLGYTKRDPLLTYYGSSGWHAHEMLFGYTVAVVAGLLLTVIRNWTKSHTVHGILLAALILLWLAGRILPLFLGIPPWVVAAVDLSFLPVLAVVITLPLLRTGQTQYWYIPVLLMVLTVANLLVHSEWLGLTMDTARLGVVLAIYTLVLLFTTLAGQFIKSITEDTPLSSKFQSNSTVEKLSVASVILLAFTDLFSPFAQIVAICGVLAAVVHARRLLGWLVRPVLSQSMIWILLVGYAWLVAGFVLLAVAYSGLISNMLAFHAIMVGGIGVLTLGIMARMSLGQTGRPLRTPPLLSLAFVLVNIAAAVRVAGPLLTLKYTKAVIGAAGALWITGFVLFLVVYTPILLHPGIDEHTG